MSFQNKLFPNRGAAFFTPLIWYKKTLNFRWRAIFSLLRVFCIAGGIVAAVPAFSASSLVASSALSKKNQAFIEYQKKKKQFEQRRERTLNVRLQQLKPQQKSLEGIEKGQTQGQIQGQTQGQKQGKKQRIKQGKRQGIKQGQAQHEEKLRQFEQRRKQAFLLYKKKHIAYEKRLKSILKARQWDIQKLQKQNQKDKDIETLYLKPH